MSKTVLIVDDNAEIRKLFREIVEGAGYQVLAAENGEIGLAMAQKNKIDCALIDQYMEPVSGFSFARHCKLYDLRFPMIMITGNDNNDLLIQARKEGFASVMMKPVDPDYLLKFLERFCR